VLAQSQFIFFVVAFFLLNLFIYFFPLTMGCSMIEFYDFIHFSFKRGYPVITTRLKILHFDPGWLKSNFFDLFLKLYFFSYFFVFQHFILLEIEFQFFFILFSMELSCSYLIC